MPGRSSAAAAHVAVDLLGVRRVDLRDRDDPVVDAEEPEDPEVLERLRLGPLTRVDDEQEEVDAGRAGDHRPDEPLVARDVDHREVRPVGELQLGVPEHDRDPAPLLLREAVGVDPGERLDELRLAVVDVTGGAEGESPHPRQAATASATSATSASEIVRQSRSVRPSRMSATTGVGAERSAAGELLFERAGEARELVERQARLRRRGRSTRRSRRR